MTTISGTSAGSAEELAQLEREVAAAAPSPPPPPPPPPPPESAGDDDPDLGAAIENALEHPEQLDRLAGLDAEELGVFCQLGFGLVADKRGAHWELSDKSAARLGKWLKRIVDKYGLEWVKAWLPELATSLLLGYEIWVRVRQDARLKAKAAKLPE